jgi:alpha-glucosidase
MVYRLASPNIIGDYSWVKPGKVAWDWWNDWGLFGVDFKVGINTKTYKAFIDFASANHIEYVILDEGWAVNKKADLFRIISQINLPEIINYGKQKGVGIILWAGYYAFDRDMEKVCRHYSEMGVKGFKIDFMNADDQQMVDFETRAAATCAKYKLLVDFHGTYKPAGINRTYPNVLNFEGVNGLEQMKWASLKEDDQVTYDETVPFIRMLAGPIDYTQGAMRNATKRNYRYIYSEPMSQGTRCHQLAEYVIFFSPLCMLCDSPSNYEREQECTDFISGVPTVWDETVPLKSEIGKYVGIARRKGDVWYLGVTNNWDARDISLKLSFLKGGRVYDAVVFEDGANADRIAMDYVKRTAEVSSDTDLKIHLAPGGGIAVKLTEVKR